MESRSRYSQFLSLLLLTALCVLSAPSQPALAQDEPLLAKDSIQVRAFTRNTRPGFAENPKWTPQVSFVLLGPIHSASMYWVEVGLPTKKNWLELPCNTVGSNEYGGPEKELICTRFDPNELEAASYTIFTGIVDFSIHVRNELKGTNATLFSGRAKVTKQATPDGPVATTWYVDEDWRLPIGYLYLRNDTLHAVLSFRESVGSGTYYLFSQGKELDQCEWSRGREPNLNKVRIEMCSVKLLAERKYGPTDVKYILNPGEYELKVLADGKLVRSVTFTVNADGSFDNGIAAANSLGSPRVIVPVKVLGTADGTWNKLAWKTEAFYGNPLTGFTAPP